MELREAPAKGIILMNWIAKLLGLLATLTLTLPLASAEPLKVGTYRKPALVVAWYRSPQFRAQLQQKHAAMAEAKEAGDSKKIQELNAWGQGSQELAHKQLAGEAGIDNILEALKPAWPEIARKAQVAIIAPDPLYLDPKTPKVDLTNEILEWMQADSATRKVIAELEAIKGPLPKLH